jgi:isochorismate hydrolase
MTNVNGDPEVLSAKAKAYLEGLGRKEKLFRLNATQAVFIAVDMQNFVCDPGHGRALPKIKQVMERINRLADFCHANDIPVIWLKQCFTQKSARDDVGLFRLFHKQPLDPRMFNQGEASEIHAGMHLDPDRDFVVEKNRYSAFAPGSSRLESLLSSMSRNQLILGGGGGHQRVCGIHRARRHAKGL